MTQAKIIEDSDVKGLIERLQSIANTNPIIRSLDETDEALLEAAAALTRLAQERDEARDDAARLHFEKMDRYEECIALRARLTAAQEENEKKSKLLDLAHACLENLGERHDAAYQALTLIESWEPATQEITVGHHMARVARAVLSTTTDGGEK